MFKRIAIAAALTLATLTSAPAANIDVFKSDGGHWYLSVTGEIDILDGIKMRGWAKAMKEKGVASDVTVVLDSPGGNVLGGLGVAATVWDMGWNTLVLADTRCASMCADIWLAGKTRYAYASSKIGMHSAGRKVGKASKAKVIRGDNSNRIMMFKRFGMSDMSIKIMLATDPNDMLWLSSDLAETMHIDYIVLGEKKADACGPGQYAAKTTTGSVCLNK